jgi:hypothetical protein
MKAPGLRATNGRAGVQDWWKCKYAHTNWNPERDDALMKTILSDPKSMNEYY